MKGDVVAAGLGEGAGGNAVDREVTGLHTGPGDGLGAADRAVGGRRADPGAGGGVGAADGHRLRLARRAVLVDALNLRVRQPGADIELHLVDGAVEVQLARVVRARGVGWVAAVAELQRSRGVQAEGAGARG